METLQLATIPVLVILALLIGLALKFGRLIDAKTETEIQKAANIRADTRVVMKDNCLKD